MVVSIFTHRLLPGGVRIATRRRSAGTTWPVLALCAGGAVTVALVWRWARAELLGDLRIPFNGWLYEEVVVGLVAGVCLLRMLSALEERQLPGRGPDLSVAFLVPAYNESHGIEDCIRSLDAAAAGHPGGCVAAYIVDNGSTDDTASVARSVLADCAHLDGAVLHCPSPGKAKALNFGLAHMNEDLVVRIDADTTVEPSLLAVVVPRFWDRSVGGVAASPCPSPAADAGSAPCD